MRRYLLTLALVGLFGALSATDAQACHKKKKCAVPCAQPAPCVIVEPCPPPPPPCPPPAKKCCLFGGHKKFKLGGLCHKSPAPCPSPVYYEGAPVAYAAPQTYGSPQAYASGQ